MQQIDHIDEEAVLADKMEMLARVGINFEIISGEVVPHLTTKGPHAVFGVYLQNQIDKCLPSDSLVDLMYSVPTIRFEPGENYEPDLVYFGQLPKFDKDNNIITVPKVVIEVLSQERRHEPGKLAIYKQYGVAEIWYIDYLKCSISCHIKQQDGSYLQQNGSRLTSPILGYTFDMDELNSLLDTLPRDEDTDH